MSSEKSSSKHSTANKSPPPQQAKGYAQVRPQPTTMPDKALAKEMARYGITRVPVDYYDYGGFRYTSLEDAMAQAKRTDHL